MKYLTKLLLTLGAVFSLALVFTASRADAYTGGTNYAQGTATWWPVSGAERYNVYYRETGQYSMYLHSVPDVPQNGTSVTINYLKPGQGYVYMVAAKNGAGAEYWLSSWMTLKTWTMTWNQPAGTGGWGGWQPQGGKWNQNAQGWGY